MGSIPPPPASTQFGSFPMPHISPAEEFIKSECNYVKLKFFS